jgi:hypothetical protein
MKNLFTCLLISCLSLATSAQITINRSDMPASGDTFRFATVLPIGANINVNKTGANQAWDFKNLNKNDEELVEYKASSKTPYAFYFFNTYGNLVADELGFGQFALKEVYNFYRATNTRFTAEGIGFKFNNFPLGGFYSDKDEIYSFPLKYNDDVTSTFRVSVQLPTVGNYVQSGIRKNEVDGWGKVTTPYKTYDCVRVKSTITQTDSFSVQQPFPVSFGFPSTRIEYKWLTKDDKVPVMEVIGNEVAGNFIANSVRYRFERKTGGGGPGVGVKEVKNNKVSVYPNPATDKIIIEIPNHGGNEVKLFTMEGKEISVRSVRLEGSIEVVVDKLADGFYMLFAKSGKEIVWEKVQVKH